jgi:hypothetical protein
MTQSYHNTTNSATKILQFMPKMFIELKKRKEIG